MVDAARQQNWDPSIQALVVFPDVIDRLNSNIRWTTELGNAFLAQQADVMHAVQRMRAEARAASKLNATTQETIATDTPCRVYCEPRIPIGPSPSHILAEAALIPLDSFLRTQSRFTRYADDIHIFCDTYEDAQAAIFAVADFLDRHQKLSLNRQKTDVKTSIEFSSAAGRMMIDDPINKAEERMLSAIRKSLQDSGEIEEEDYSTIQLSDLDKADSAAFSPSLIESVLEGYLAGQGTFLRLRWFLRRLGQIGAPGGVNSLRRI